MSYSELKAFDKNGNVVCLEEFRNSHYIPVIWDVLATKYGVREKVMRRLAAEQRIDLDTCTESMRRNIELQARGALMQNMQPVWDLQKNPDLSEVDYRCLMFTFDNAVIAPEDIEAFAEAFDSFEGVPDGTINHGRGFAACMRKALEDIPGIRGIALYSTSVCEDPWGSVRLPLDACPECGGRITVDGDGPECRNPDCPEDYLEYDYRPYNMDQDDKHWFIPSQKEHLKEEADA